MSEDTILNSLITTGKNGFSAAEAGDCGDWALCLYFKLGEKSFITSGHTRSFSKKLNSLCWKGKLCNFVETEFISIMHNTINFLAMKKSSDDFVKISGL